MFYGEYAANSFLSDYIDCYWSMQGFIQEEETKIISIYPDGCIDIIVNLGDPIYRPGLAKSLLLSKYVVGAMSNPGSVELTGEVSIFGIRFRPGGAYPFLEIPLKNLTDKVADLLFISKRVARELDSDRLSEALYNLDFSVLDNSLS